MGGTGKATGQRVSEDAAPIARVCVGCHRPIAVGTPDRYRFCSYRCQWLSARSPEHRLAEAASLEARAERLRESADVMHDRADALEWEARAHRRAAARQTRPKGHDLGEVAA